MSTLSEVPATALTAKCCSKRCTNANPSSNDMTPAAQRAAYSPASTPAMQKARATTSGRCLFN
eukprot:CAMPEP_0179171266 /NCGR_PEP_ID=MMETSP0796-20121207/84416_1 /TAXON_ID=73915 /ORGANISM="Pyrodinium bahamense, Strain pbaha01" /LENGTH=62 /DNA_ID=CAMNT_0020874321 /DNA_START=64 /DNA_END=249 /DNA_ORIENTATION=+